MTGRLTLFAAGLALAAAVGAAGLAQARGSGTNAGRYTVAQAEAGAGIYAINCALCHGRRLEGVGEVPSLTGRFVAHWAGRPVADLFAYISQAMPQHAPGTLSPEQNAQLVALILQANGVPAGPNPLPAQETALRRITFEAPLVAR